MTIPFFNTYFDGPALVFSSGNDTRALDVLDGDDDDDDKVKDGDGDGEGDGEGDGDDESNADISAS
jgi:hypothetical protein